MMRPPASFARVHWLLLAVALVVAGLMFVRDRSGTPVDPIATDGDSSAAGAIAPATLATDDVS
ncbi:MAG: hypothetical protein Q8N51_12500, partial [Gammaproteobacteria bacterium]|nr:hypothetical protein [Gammaproteobacteria bacterium]